MRTTRIPFLILILNLILTFTYAQTIEINGELIDKETKDHIPFAHIYLDGTSLGTSSNEDGYFSFIIPQQYQDKTITVSSLGFQSTEVKISSFPKRKYKKIIMEVSPLMLQTVVITTEEPKKIWKAAAKNHQKMFNGPHHRLQGFYRTTFQEDGYFSRLLEAAVNVHSTGDSRKYPQIEYLGFRKSNDLRNNVWEIYDGYLNHLVNYHPVRSGYDFLRPSGVNKYDIELKEQTYIDDDLYYVLFATGPRKGPFDVEMIIRERDLAIFKVTLFFHPENSDNYSWAWERKDSAKFVCDWQVSTYEYQEFGGKMFSKSARWHRAGRVIDINTGETRFETESIDELLITSIDIGKYDYLAEESFESLNIYEMADYFSYEPEFWSSYNKPVDSEYFRKAKSKLEEFQPLELQYQKYTGTKMATIDPD